MAPPERVITAVRVQTALFLFAAAPGQHLTHSGWQGVKSREFSHRDTKALLAEPPCDVEIDVAIDQ